MQTHLKLLYHEYRPSIWSKRNLTLYLGAIRKNGFGEDPYANLRPQSIKNANPNKIKLERRKY